MSRTDLAKLAIVEQSQSLGKQLAIDHAFAKAGDDAEADAARQFGQGRPTRLRLCDSMCWRRLRSTTQSTLLPVALARWVRLFQISSA